MNIYESLDDFNRIMKHPRKSRLDACVMSIIRSCDVSDFNPYHIRKKTEHYCNIFVLNEATPCKIFILIFAKLLLENDFHMYVEFKQVNKFITTN